MDKDEFVKSAVRRGYATKRIAEMYAEAQDTFTQNDLVQVYALQREPTGYSPPRVSLGDGNYKRKAIFYD